MHLAALLAAVSLLSSAFATPVQQPLYLPKNEAPLPLIIWHGLGDTYTSDGLHTVGELAQKMIPGLYVHYIHLANDTDGDRDATFFGNLTLELDQVCADLASDPFLATAPAVNALGFSQGGQFLRGYVERCNFPPVANLVTFGSQHNGIARFQNCGATDWLCKAANALLRGKTWSELVQSRVVPAQYYRDPDDLESYLSYSNWLADVNNERAAKNETYKENMKRLKKFVMYVFDEDETVIPKQSGWFSEFNLTSSEETKLQNRTIYKEDWLGLKWLDENNRLEFVSTPGAHMHLTKEVLQKAFAKYFSAGTDQDHNMVSFEL